MVWANTSKVTKDGPAPYPGYQEVAASLIGAVMGCIGPENSISITNRNLTRDKISVQEFWFEWKDEHDKPGLIVTLHREKKQIDFTLYKPLITGEFVPVAKNISRTKHPKMKGEVMVMTQKFDTDRIDASTVRSLIQTYKIIAGIRQQWSEDRVSATIPL